MLFTAGTRLHDMGFLSIVSSLIAWLDQANVFVLGLIALFARSAADQLHTELPWRDFAKVTACAFLFGYAIHLAPSIDWDELLEVFALLLRAMVVSYLFYLLIAAPAVFVTHLTTRYVQSEWHRMRDFSKDLAEQHRRRKAIVPVVPLPPAPPPPPREVVVQRRSEQARLDYEFECQIIRNANLSEDERECALEQAKQKYVQRLADVLQ